MHLFLVTLSFALLALSSPPTTTPFGDIIINDRLAPRVQPSWTLDVTRIKDTQIYDILARFYGTPRVHNHNEVRVNVDLFDRPEGLISFSLDGVAGNELSRGSFRTFDSSALELDVSSDPHDAFSVLASTLTGLNLKDHGVVNNRKPSAVNYPTYTAGNFYDAVSEKYDVDVVSGSYSIDSANVVSPSVVHKKSKAYAWNPIKKEFNGKAGGFAFGKAAFGELFQRLSQVLEKRVVYSIEEHSVSIYLDEASPVVFDLADMDDESLMTEVLFVLNAADQSPVSFFSFHFESPKNMLRKYGPTSAEYGAALVLIDAVISSLIESYPETHASIIYYFPATYAQPAVVATLLAKLQGNIQTPAGVLPSATLVAYLPHVYLNSMPSMTQSRLCVEVTEAIAALDLSVDVICPFSASQKRALLQDASPVPTPTPTPGPAPNPNKIDITSVSMMHIILWTSILLVVGLVVANMWLAVLDGSNEPEFKSRSFELRSTQKVQ